MLFPFLAPVDFVHEDHVDIRQLGTGAAGGTDYWRRRYSSPPRRPWRRFFIVSAVKASICATAPEPGIPQGPP